jgi:hypothetical protein
MKTIAHATTTSTFILPILSGIDMFHNGCERIDCLKLSESFGVESSRKQVGKHSLTYFYVNIMLVEKVTQQLSYFVALRVELII